MAYSLSCSILLSILSSSLSLVILSTTVSCASNDIIINSNNNNNNNISQQVEVGIYYESLCPDSRSFFLRQLLPVYKEIGSIIRPVLVPFGHARIVGQDKIICQHGPKECEGNRLAACIQSRSPDDGAAINTIGCLFDRKMSTKECIERNLVNVSFDDIDKCKNSNDSFNMMRGFETRTGQAEYIPKLTLNGDYSEEIQNNLEFHLKTTVCKNYNGTKPVACSS